MEFLEFSNFRFGLFYTRGRGNKRITTFLRFLKNYCLTHNFDWIRPCPKNMSFLICISPRIFSFSLIKKSKKKKKAHRLENWHISRRTRDVVLNFNRCKILTRPSYMESRQYKDLSVSQVFCAFVTKIRNIYIKGENCRYIW